MVTSSPINRQVAAPRQTQGVTLLEILVVIAILGVLSALAAPSFRGTIERYRVSTTVDQLTSTISLARAEAIKRGGNVRLERLSGGDCPAMISVQQWSCGWSLYWDVNANNAFNAGTDELIKEFRITNNVTVNFSVTQAGITVNRWGQLGNLGAAGFTVVPQSGVSSPATSTVCLSTGGRIRTVSGSVAC
jgi:type IV fimbrial biogenesis protein FimT